MTISWGWKITILYSGFVIMMVGLVVASSHQKIDLVSKDYYKDEIAYQKVLDASRNQATLAGSLLIHASADNVVIDFSDEFAGKQLKGDIDLYSAAHEEWDRHYPVSISNGSVAIPRSGLRQTIYTVKVSYIVDGKSYYSESQLNLRAL